MSHRHNALTVAELWDETQRLNEQVAALQARLARYEKVDSADSVEASNDEADVWNVWPYCWVTGAYHRVLERFHSFHATLHSAWLTGRNRRLRVAFWQKPHPEEIELKLL